VLSLGSGFKKTLSYGCGGGIAADDVIAPRKERQAWVDNDGATFKSYLDGSACTVLRPSIPYRFSMALVQIYALRLTS
jgi:hypothetical protein